MFINLYFDLESFNFGLFVLYCDIKDKTIASRDSDLKKEDQ